MSEINEKCTFKAPRGEKWNELNLTARAVYIAIAISVDFKTHKCDWLSREKIASYAGIKDVDDISKYTNQLKEANLIDKKTIYVGPKDKRVIYEIAVESDYTLVKNNIVKSGLSPKAIALFCTIAAQRYKHSHRVKVTAKDCGVSNPTFKKYIKELVDNEVIAQEGDYIIFKKYVKTQDYLFDEKLLEMMQLDKDSRAYNLALYAINHPERINNIDAYVDYIYSGVKRK